MSIDATIMALGSWTSTLLYHGQVGGTIGQTIEAIRMKVLIVSFVAAIVATVLLTIAGHVYGYHSTAGFWFAFLNIPGILVGSWVNALIKGDGEWMDHLPGFCLCAFANWGAYFGLGKAALFLRQRISRLNRHLL